CASEGGLRYGPRAMDYW
nr:immunoglobulin heavy chain junction region [Mus musculus]MBK4197241.1 immunoglobulin heavy chain junction region [Mus musculus]